MVIMMIRKELELFVPFLQLVLCKLTYELLFSTGGSPLRSRLALRLRSYELLRSTRAPRKRIRFRRSPLNGSYRQTCSASEG